MRVVGLLKGAGTIMFFFGESGSFNFDFIF